MEGEGHLTNSFVLRKKSFDYLPFYTRYVTNQTLHNRVIEYHRVDGVVVVVMVVGSVNQLFVNLFKNQPKHRLCKVQTVAPNKNKKSILSYVQLSKSSYILMRLP